MDPIPFLLHFLPTHWPKDWHGSFQTKDHGEDHKIDVVTHANHTTHNGKPMISFDFTVEGKKHKIEAEIVDFHGAAKITLDNILKSEHPVLNVGTAFHFPQSTTAIVHFIFIENGERQNYRFEGKIN